MPTTRLGLVIALGLLFVLPTRASADGDIFADLTLEAALAKAGETDKMVVIDFFATWCGPCKQMDKDTWPDEDVVAWVEKHAILIKVDVDKEEAVAKEFNITAMPTIVFLKADKSEISRFVDAYSATQFVSFGNKVLSGDAPPPGAAPSGGDTQGRDRGRNAPASQAAVAKIPTMSSLGSEKAYWRWIAMFAFAAVVCMSCFKNPKRSHNN
ncbi:MAG: thioredoxin family protein [Planctomycetes bacterium]|nr:thioredoxin family protein [Planctomycetota bacterium]